MPKEKTLVRFSTVISTSRPPSRAHLRLGFMVFSQNATCFISDSSHLQKPIHADVLLRIESTTSESSNTEKMNEESKIKQNIEEIKNPTKITEQINQQEKSTEQNLNLIEDAESMEIIGDKTEPTSRITSDDEGNF